VRFWQHSWRLRPRPGTFPCASTVYQRQRCAAKSLHDLSTQKVGHIGLLHGAVHHGQPIFGVPLADFHMGVDLAQVHVAVTFLIVAPSAEKATEELELRGTDVVQAMPFEVHFHDRSALRQGLDQVVEMVDKQVNLLFAANLFDHGFHGMSTLRASLLRVVMRQGNDHGRQAFLLTVQLADLNRGAGFGMGHVYAGKGDVLAKDG
jgi:hypothetical protein